MTPIYMQRAYRLLVMTLTGMMTIFFGLPFVEKTHHAAGTDVNELVFQGADCHFRGELDNALRKFEAAVRIDTKNEYAYNQLGILYAKKNQFEKAYHCFAVVEGIDRRNTFAKMWLGILQLRNGSMERAFEKFEEIIQIDPGHADAYYFIGTIYYFMHNPVMAVEYLKKARDSDSEEAETHFRLAKAFHNLDMVVNARLEYQRAIEIKPNYTQAINELGWVFYNAGETEKAYEQWEKTLMINSRDRDAIFNLAKAYNDSALKALLFGNKQKALAYWKKTLNINPSDKAAKYYIEKYGY